MMDGIVAAWGWLVDQIQPVLRPVSKFLKKIFGEHYDENMILRPPLSSRRK